MKKVIQTILVMVGILMGIGSLQARDVDFLFSAQEGDLEVMKAMVEDGMDVNYRGLFRERTAIEEAAGKGHLEVVEYLIEQGAEVDIPDHFGYTALHKAALGGYDAIVKLLIEKKANVNAVTYEYGGPTTPLMEATAWGYREGNIKTAKMLLDAGADVNFQNRYGYTPLSTAATRGHRVLVAMYLEAGADVNPATIIGSTAVTMAAYDNNTDIVEMLCAVKEEKQDRLTKLTCAIMEKDLEGVKEVASDTRYWEHCTPEERVILEVLRKLERSEIEEYLRNKWGVPDEESWHKSVVDLRSDWCFNRDSGMTFKDYIMSYWYEWEILLRHGG